MSPAVLIKNGILLARKDISTLKADMYLVDGLNFAPPTSAEFQWNIDIIWNLKTLRKFAAKMSEIGRPDSNFPYKVST